MPQGLSNVDSNKQLPYFDIQLENRPLLKRLAQDHLSQYNSQPYYLQVVILVEAAHRRKHLD